MSYAEYVSAIRVWEDDSYDDDNNPVRAWFVDGLDEDEAYTESCWTFPTFEEAIYEGVVGFSQYHLGSIPSRRALREMLVNQAAIEGAFVFNVERQVAI